MPAILIRLLHFRNDFGRRYSKLTLEQAREMAHVVKFPSPRDECDWWGVMGWTGLGQLAETAGHWLVANVGMNAAVLPEQAVHRRPRAA